MKRLKKIAVLVAVAATALLVATVAFGATPGDDGNAKLCSVKYGPHKGEVRLMDSSTTACHSSEQSVTLATAASIPTPQPTPTVTTDFLQLKYDPDNPGVPQVVRQTAGITATVSNSQCTHTSQSDGTKVYSCTFDLDFGRSLDSAALFVERPVRGNFDVRNRPTGGWDTAGSVAHMETYGPWGPAKMVVIG